MAKVRDIRKIQLYIIITLAALVGGGFALMRLIQRNRARKVDKNISLALSNPNLTVDEKGDVIENGGNGNGNGVFSAAVAQSKAKALVDDIWGYTWTIKKNIWTQLMNYNDSEFARNVGNVLVGTDNVLNENLYQPLEVVADGMGKAGTGLNEAVDYAKGHAINGIDSSMQFLTGQDDYLGQYGLSNEDLFEGGMILPSIVGSSHTRAINLIKKTKKKSKPMEIKND